MPPRTVEFTPTINSRNSLGKIDNPVKPEPLPYDKRKNRDLSKFGEVVQKPKKRKKK